MALTLHYIGNVAWRQNKPPQWSKTFSGDADTCSLTFQGAQYLEKAFLDAVTLAKFGSMVYINEAGVSVTDTGMFFTGFSSDDAAIFPTVTLQFTGFRNGELPSAVPEDDVTIQSAQTTKHITDSTSPNYNKTITLAIEYRCARTTWSWSQAGDPGATSPYTSVRQPISPTLGSVNITYTHFSGMVDSSGEPSNTISTGDATAVFNTFSLTTRSTSFSSKETVPGCVWTCQAVNERVLKGA